MSLETEPVQIGDISVAAARLGYGTYHLLDKINASQALDSFAEAFEVGINLFDSSDNYGTKSIIGRAVSAGILPRDEVIIATKTGLATTLPEQRQMKELSGAGHDTTTQRVRAQIDNSLRVLGDDVGCIDLYQLHVPDERVSHEEHAELMSELIESGKIVEYGLSNYSKEQLEQFLAACDDRGLRRPAAIQPYFNMLAAKSIPEVGLAQDEGIVVLAHSPLLKGALAGLRREKALELFNSIVSSDSEGEIDQFVIDNFLAVHGAIDDIEQTAESQERTL